MSNSVSSLILRKRLNCRFFFLCLFRKLVLSDSSRAFLCLTFLSSSSMSFKMFRALSCSSSTLSSSCSRCNSAALFSTRTSSTNLPLSPAISSTTCLKPPNSSPAKLLNFLAKALISPSVKSPDILSPSIAS